MKMCGMKSGLLLNRSLRRNKTGQNKHVTIMGAERPQFTSGFDFTDRERLFGVIGHQRFMRLLTDTQTTVHAISVTSNEYGEFLFVTMSRPDSARGERVYLTFWGGGYHEQRERWITNEWQ